MARRCGAAVLLAVALTLLAAGCGTKPVVGVLLPSTGEAGTYGESIESGIRLAVTVYREKSLLPRGFEVVWADSASDPARAVTELKKMVRDRGARLVIGGATSAEARAILPELERLGVVCLSPSASAPDLAKQSSLFFRIYPSDELEGHTAATFLYERLGQKQVVVYQGNDEYVRGIEPAFRKQFEDALRGSVAAVISLDEAGWRERSALALNSTGVGAVYVVGFAGETLEVLRHLAEQQFAGRVVASSAFYSTQVIREAGPLAEGVLFPLPPFDRTSEKEPVLSFVNRYMDAYNRAPDVFAAHGYDAMRYTIEVMRLAPGQLTEIRQGMQFGVRDFMGVTGPIVFDDFGGVKHYPKMFVVKGGQVLSYERWLEGERSRIFRDVQDILFNKG
ncbi:MAG TPA: penicillin-binding protein activator [Thermoanaerobaculales bacterium]|nr:penicillin-binding protein activator [Thermoanaerobaculales bacterium]HPA80167.1 penicillin-binding protein activator [Thermoanaerobaculales bacterium]HQL28680.1 penicillin-binding protein activator [Thermoanaerobaculales bacterium]HQN96747.1 penicillin-binding protein activator [Thermoanaerobaculales bacterium]HQP43211.1 penicillin-binding protein activator [Thermoanaerobaculales bacterium]